MTEAETGVPRLQAEGHQGLWEAIRNYKKGTLQRGPTLPIPTSSFSNCGEITSCCSKSPSLWHCVQL